MGEFGVLAVREVTAGTTQRLFSSVGVVSPWTGVGAKSRIVVYMFRTVTQPLSRCATGYPVIQPDIQLRNRVHHRCVTRIGVISMAGCGAAAMAENAKESFEEYINSAFPIDGKRTRNAVIRRSLAQRITAYLKD